jgi:hypothetical protein
MNREVKPALSGSVTSYAENKDFWGGAPSDLVKTRFISSAMPSTSATTFQAVLSYVIFMHVSVIPMPSRVGLVLPKIESSVRTLDLGGFSGKPEKNRIGGDTVILAQLRYFVVFVNEENVSVI